MEGVTPTKFCISCGQPCPKHSIFYHIAIYPINMGRSLCHLVASVVLLALTLIFLPIALACRRTLRRRVRMLQWSEISWVTLVAFTGFLVVAVGVACPPLRYALNSRLDGYLTRKNLNFLHITQERVEALDYFGYHTFPSPEVLEQDYRERIRLIHPDKQKGDLEIASRSAADLNSHHDVLLGDLEIASSSAADLNSHHDVLLKVVGNSHACRQPPPSFHPKADLEEID